MTSLRSLARRLASNGPHKIHPASPRRIRILLGGHYIADTTTATFVWEHPGYPFFYIENSAFKGKSSAESANAVRWKHVEDVSANEDGTGETIAKLWKVEAGGKETERVLEFVKKGSLDGLVRVEFKAVDQWFEEDVPVLVHPKDPFKRISCLPSTRPVSVTLNNHSVASSPFAVHLLETGLPCRYYLPFTSIDPSILRRSDTRTQCPYKGEAEYYDVVLPGGKDGKDGETVFKDLVWYYDRPNLEVAAVQGLACFYNEKVDIEVGGERLQRPKTHWS